MIMDNQCYDQTKFKVEKLMKGKGNENRFLSRIFGRLIIEMPHEFAHTNQE
jgi:hypothetical protein